MTPCDRTGCTSGKSPLWAPTLVFWSVLPGATGPMRLRVCEGELSMRLCDDCRDTVTLADMLDDLNWQQIVGYWPRGRVLPERALTELEFTFYDDVEDEPSIHSEAL
jgi:hypothetical protein